MILGIVDLPVFLEYLDDHGGREVFTDFFDFSGGEVHFDLFVWV